MLPLEKEIENKLIQIESSMSLDKNTDNKTIEDIATLISTIEENYSEKEYKIFYGNEIFCCCLTKVQQLVAEKAAALASKIQAILVHTNSTNSISTLPSETIYKHIIPFMSTSQNKFTTGFLTGKTHRAFACTSKKNKELVEKTNKEWNDEHLALKDQQSDVKSKGFKSCEEAIAYTIEKGYAVLDLRNFNDVTDEIIEKLFKDYSHLNHFRINSSKITKLACCSKLQTLDCSYCTALAALPADMANLATLNCSGCTALAALPAGMTNLATLNCSGCTALAALPAGMTKLAELVCYDCTALTALPAGMANLATLVCLNCTALETLPADMAKLATIVCGGCTALEALPADMANLAKLYCYDCTALTALPAGMTKLAELVCYGCTALAALPADMANLAKLDFRGCTALKALPAGMAKLPRN